MRLRALLSALIPLAIACGSDSTTAPVSIEQTTFASSLGVNLSASTKTASGLYYRDITVGTGATLASGRTVGMRYSGAFVNGTVFDANPAPKAVFTFVLGSGQVIKGWDEGLVGMKVGGTRQLIIPPSLGYGDEGNQGIPPAATLVFEVELLGVKDAPKEAAAPAPAGK